MSTTYRRHVHTGCSVVGMTTTTTTNRFLRLVAAIVIGVILGLVIATVTADDADATTSTRHTIRHVDPTRQVGAWLVRPGVVNATAGSTAGHKIDAGLPGHTYRVRGFGLFRVSAVTLSSSLPSKAGTAVPKVGWDLRLHTVHSDRFLFLDRI